MRLMDDQTDTLHVATGTWCTVQCTTVVAFRSMLKKSQPLDSRLSTRRLFPGRPGSSAQLETFPLKATKNTQHQIENIHLGRLELTRVNIIILCNLIKFWQRRRMITSGLRLTTSCARRVALAHPKVCVATNVKHFSTENSSPLDQFRDSVAREKRFTESVGRSWTVKELRRKSFDDLHKLWWVAFSENSDFDSAHF